MFYNFNVFLDKQIRFKAYFKVIENVLIIINIYSNNGFISLIGRTLLITNINI